MDKTIWAIGGVTLVVLLGVLVFGSQSRTTSELLATSFSAADSEVISETGIHWHAQLAIVIRGEKQDIPANVGIGSQHVDSPFYNPLEGLTDIHTHDASGTLHWEIATGPVKRGQLKLGVFFGIWGKPFSSQQIFDSITGAGGTVSMTVNGQPNTDFEKYVIHDKDVIEIRYQ